MKTLILIVGLVLIFETANCQTKNFIDQPFLETTAKVDSSVTPDKIYLSILISEADTKGKQTVEELEISMGEKLKAIGIDLESQLKLSDLSSNFKKYFLKKQDILKAKSYELLVYNANSAGQVIYEMEGIGISNVDLEKTEYSMIEELKLKLKSKAVKKAKLQAEHMANSIHQKIGNAIHISDNFTQVANVLNGIVAGLQMDYSSKLNKEKVVLPIEFEKIKVESEVNVKFILE